MDVKDKSHIKLPLTFTIINTLDNPQCFAMSREVLKPTKLKKNKKIKNKISNDLYCSMWVLFAVEISSCAKKKLILLTDTRIVLDLTVFLTKYDLLDNIFIFNVNHYNLRSIPSFRVEGKT